MARGMRLLLSAALACGVCALLPAAAPAAPAFIDGHGLHVLSATALDKRLIEVTVQSPALASPAHVRVLLPADYESHPTKRFPVLYLLHGTSGGAADWTGKG